MSLAMVPPTPRPRGLSPVATGPQPRVPDPTQPASTQPANSTPQSWPMREASGSYPGDAKQLSAVADAAGAPTSSQVPFPSRSRSPRIYASAQPASDSPLTVQPVQPVQPTAAPATTGTVPTETATETAAETTARTPLVLQGPAVVVPELGAPGPRVRPALGALWAAPNAAELVVYRPRQHAQLRRWLAAAALALLLLTIAVTLIVIGTADRHGDLVLIGAGLGAFGFLVFLLAELLCRPQRGVI